MSGIEKASICKSKDWKRRRRVASEVICTYRSADKSLARPGRKQATVTKYNFCKPLKKKIRKLYLKPGLRGSNDLRVGQKMATFQMFFQTGRSKDLSVPLYKESSSM